MSGCVPFVALQDVYVFCIFMPSVSRQYIHLLKIGVVIYPTAVYASCDIGLAYPTAVYTRFISSLTYPTAMYTRSVLVYPTAMYTRSVPVYPYLNHFFLKLTLLRCNNKLNKFNSESGPWPISDYSKKFLKN